MNAKELQAEIEANGVYWIDGDGDKKRAGWETFKSSADEGEWYLQDGTKIDPVDSFREDEYWYHIINLNNRYFRLVGDYDYWNGVEWGYAELKEVYPKEVKKTVWSTEP